MFYDKCRTTMTEAERALLIEFVEAILAHVAYIDMPARIHRRLNDLIETVKRERLYEIGD